MNTQKVRCVIFDNGEVLYGGILPFNMRINQLFSPKQPLKNGDLFGTVVMQEYLCGRISELQLWREIISIHALRAEPADLARMVRHEFIPVDGTLEIAKELQAAGYKLGILSVHGREWVQFLNTRYDFHRHFHPECIEYSYEGGRMKPDQEAFDEVIRKTGYPADECLFIDDSARNCEAAARLGMSTHLFSDAHSLRADLERRRVLSSRNATLPSW